MNIDELGIASLTRFIASPNCDFRAQTADIRLIVIHNISLPPSQFGGMGIIELFTNQLHPEQHLYYADIAHLRVSSHFLIRRDGELIQFVPCSKRAWHAGLSNWQGWDRCNDFSVGIELEGDDYSAFTDAQYQQLNALIIALQSRYPNTALTGHSDIAPGRKTDPGPYFDWSRLKI
ncbi:MAG: 1,6-anhydro-N-acetylmuramyl-L-alanine amidase AmpD [Sulfuriferula sp.]|nr:1,6-anhydro-N-acetylmuramyl-L-alanine amidase AmpD [Sulfuriferula sp.]